MLKLVPLLLGALFLSFAETGCEQKKTQAQLNAEKDKLAKEERKKQAVKFYQELVEKYPDSEYAAQAKARLQAIGPVATPAGGKATPKAATAQK
jgi:predicted Zn-dependent protease